MKVFINKDKAEAYVEEFKSIPRGLFSCYSVRKHEIPVYPDDTWESIMERGDKLLIQRCNRRQWEKWCLEQEQLADIERRRETKDELKSQTEKYQIALELASVDIVKCIEEGLEGCDVCPERTYCEAHKHDTIHLDCGEMFLESWKKKAGIE